MATTVNICRSLGIGFMNLDVDEAIMIINYFIDSADDLPSTDGKTARRQEERIKVNDKTATGGWY